ncbi:uncharacterized protein [Halyomorpha halys]|uniref:uncharacterized protein isoform X2 n=1 Tax=Halyomorpha halys TaxID=286706 RepID=UPI0006D520BF|nr:uncharacterized protein LOC106679160 isoform X2 [Halyomorpha halys]
MHYTLLCLSLFLILILSVSTDAKDICPRIKPAVGLKISEIFGTWYAVRGIEHVSAASNSNAKQTKSCPMIKIVSKDNLIEFQWHSKDKPLKKLDLKQNKDNPGLLEPVNKKGSSKSSLQLTLLNNNKNVIGVTMCKPGGKTASVILHREPTFAKDEVQSVTSLLGSQGLDIDNIFDRCLKNI